MYWFEIHKFALGKLGWTEKEYYTCSPYMFLAACEGYFDKMDERITLARNVALFASQRSSDEFNKAWPVAGGKGGASVKTWGTKEEATELRAQIEKAHKIKLS